MPDFGFDEWMDAQLRNVPVPRNLHARLSAGRPPSDEELDASLRDVPLPPHLDRHLRRIAWLEPGPRRFRTLALAASVLIVVASGAWLWVSREATPTVQPLVARQSAPKRAAQPVKTAPNSALAQRPPKAAPRRQQPVTVPLGDAPKVAKEDNRKLPFTIQDVASVGTTVKQAIETKLREQAALGAGGKIEQLPELGAFEPPTPRGVRPPRLRGYDMLFQLKHDEHPFVSPAAHVELRASRLPFTFRTTSYDLAAAAIDKGQLPAREDIRVEDFLAAQRYAVPAAPVAALALHAAASPSPLGEGGLHLLQLVVQGGKTREPRRQPARLIAVVDTSSAMQFEARAKTLERGLATLAQKMAPADRLTLIAFAQQPRVLAEDATREELEKLLSSGALRQTAGSADFVSAIQSACAAVRAVPSSQPRQVVFVTAGRAEFDDTQLARSSESLLQLVAANIPWQIVRMSAADEKLHWSDLARTAQGRTCAVTSADELSAALAESLTGRPQTVALGVSARITFNPKVVTSYRMLGHESTTLTGDAGDPLEVDLQGEQTATTMYELWLKPSGAGEVAIVEVLWRDPTNGQPRRKVQPIGRAQIASSFALAPGWLQQGILAGATAEFLRASYYVPGSRRLDQLLQLAGEVDPRAAETPEFLALVRLIAQAVKLH